MAYYKFSYNLGISHYTSDDPESMHRHTYRLVFSLASFDGGLVNYSDIDTLVESKIRYFESAPLNDLPEFAGILPTAEALTEIIYKQMKPFLEGYGIRLMKLAVSETPLRMFSISDRLQRLGMAAAAVLVAVLTMAKVFGPAASAIASAKADESSIKIDGDFSDWDESDIIKIKDYRASEIGCRAQNGDLYLYLKDAFDGTALWDRIVTIKADNDKEINVGLSRSEYGQPEDHIYNMGVTGVDGAICKAKAYANGSKNEGARFEYEVKIPEEALKGAKSIDFVKPYTSVTLIKGVGIADDTAGNASGKNSDDAVDNASGKTAEDDDSKDSQESFRNMSGNGAAATEDDADFQKDVKFSSNDDNDAGDSSTDKSGLKAPITIDGYYEDWQGIDVPNAFTWGSNNNESQHDGGIIADGENLYVHAKMNVLYEAQIPVDELYITVNDTNRRAFIIRYENPDGSINWDNKVYHLPVGSTSLAVYDRDTQQRVGSAYVTIGVRDDKGEHIDQWEISVDKKALSRLTGIDEALMDTFSFYDPNIGPQSITVSGTPTGSWLLVLIMFGMGIAGIAAYKKGRNKKDNNNGDYRNLRQGNCFNKAILTFDLFK
ncbi:MAG: Firmicu-CTERM sorting domain-containing protein [Lachnospiraceae bacterium]|nr:Firmicu-CTERM sorting domain-containing protein [Lachnospiraceae bacterium]MEE3460951.1 Firmicu-CTERM sorting domain-containing protein [Lachnospiraceae bacterium]